MRRLFKVVFIAILGFVALVFVFSQLPESPENAKPETVERPSIPEPPLHPNAVARALNAAPGAIVCPNLQSVSSLFHLYSEHWEQETRSRMTNGQSESIEGPVSPAPNPADYGCWLLPPGTPVEAMNGEGLLSGIPVVTGRLQDGTMVHGVTLVAMLAAKGPDSKSEKK